MYASVKVVRCPMGTGKCFSVSVISKKMFTKMNCPPSLLPAPFKSPLKNAKKNKTLRVLINDSYYAL